MRYWWDHLFSSSDRAYTIASGGEVTATVGMLMDWAFEEGERGKHNVGCGSHPFSKHYHQPCSCEKWATEHQADNQESSR